ncbi:MAG: YdcF family protein [Alphaproteobacteria bacterium]|nr:YdcF family protein [Alphaproteobacteria bacterium]
MIKQLLTFIFYPLAIAFPIWLIGFGVFVLYVFSFHFSQNTNADAIVAWTGGGYRIQTAIALLEEGASDKLLISGVNRNVKPESFLGDIRPEIREKIDLGYQATTTEGNALETADWVYKNKVKSIILVTSFYHIPRSLLEFKYALPNITVYPNPIWPKDFTESTAWIHTRSAFHLFVEYHKFLCVKLYYFLKGFSQ